MWIRLRSTTQTKLKKKWNSFLWKWSPYANRLEQNNNKNTSRWHKIAYNWQLSCMGNKTKSHTDWGFFSLKKTCCFNCGCVVRTAIGGIIGRTDWLMEIFYSNSKSTTHLSLSVQHDIMLLNNGLKNPCDVFDKINIKYLLMEQMHHRRLQIEFSGNCFCGYVCIVCRIFPDNLLSTLHIPISKN